MVFLLQWIEGECGTARFICARLPPLDELQDHQLIAVQSKRNVPILLSFVKEYEISMMEFHHYGQHAWPVRYSPA
ncbi:MAG: hypothetical protein AAAC47_23515 [Pararhizobium sp.]|jgi:hypothetical protein